MNRYAEMFATDPELQAFVAARIAQAGIDGQSWKVEAEHWKKACAELQRKIDAMKAQKR